MNKLLIKRSLMTFGLGAMSFISGCATTAAEKPIGNSAGPAAAKFSIYAMAANNAYKDSSRKHFDLPDNWKRIKQVNDEQSGLQFDIYEVSEEGGAKNLIVAFRGTDSENDNPATSKKQYELVDKLMPDIIKNSPNAKIIAVGHSLGGALALHTSLVFDNIDAYAFNPSPRIYRHGNNKPNKRYMINEKGDPLNTARIIWKAVPGTEEWEFDFSEHGEKQHFSYPLALGLLLLGSTEEDSGLLAIMHKNCDVKLQADCDKMKSRIKENYNIVVK